MVVRREDEEHAGALMAAQASLRYVDDAVPGIRRRRAGRAFAYFDSSGKLVRDRTALNRIKALAIPPAYEDVWICPIPNGHLQATGRDARGRKQYRYHQRWREVRDEAKYRRTLAFARALPALRARASSDLGDTALSKDKVVGTIVELLDTTLARVGNESYARDNASFGLTTLRSRHVQKRRDGLRLHFRGKSGIEHDIKVTDRRLASVIRRCRDLPGQDLFSYAGPDGPVPIRSDDINDYVRDAMGSDFSAKDFRTWHGTVLCALALESVTCDGSPAQRRRVVSDAIKEVALSLRNTPAVCRACYIHPSVIDRFMLDGALNLPKSRRGPPSTLSADEDRVLRFLEREARRDERADLRRALRRSLRAAA